MTEVDSVELRDRGVKQHWAFQGRMRSGRMYEGVDCYVWFWHPVDGVHPEAEKWHHFVHWIPVSKFWPVGGTA